MANGTWKRSTSATRRADRQIRYAHVSVQVSVSVSEETGMLTPSRTPKGSGSTATRAKPNQGRGPKRVGHDWPGKYPGQLASIEALRKERRKMNQLKRLPLERLLISTEGSESAGCTGIPIDFLNTEEDLT